MRQRMRTKAFEPFSVPVGGPQSNRPKGMMLADHAVGQRILNTDRHLVDVPASVASRLVPTRNSLLDCSR